jgi:hypothetical protein
LAISLSVSLKIRHIFHPGIFCSNFETNCRHSAQSGGDLIIVEGFHTGYIVQVGGQSVNTSLFLDNSVGFVSPALRPGLHSIHVLNFQRISVAESS